MQPGVYLVAGNAGGTGNVDGTGHNARFYNPLGIARDPSGIIYVSDANNYAIRKISKVGEVSTLPLSSQFPGDTSLRSGTQMAVDREGNLIVAGWGCGSYLIKIAPDGTKTYLDSSGKIFSYPPGWYGRSACYVTYQVGVALGPAGEYYVSDPISNAIRKVNPDGGVSTIAGTDFVAGSTDGAGASALFNLPAGLALDAAGNLFVADLGNNTIRKISPAGVVTTVAGKAGIKGSTDGSVSAALFNAPQSIVVDAQGNAVAMTTTIEGGFGSHLMTKAGFLLNNELTDFNFAPQEDGKPVANRVEPGKRPRSSMAPTLVFDAFGRLYAVAGSPGGSQIIEFVAKTLVALLDWRMDPQQAADFGNFGSRNGPTELETGRFPASEIEALKARGHTVRVFEQTSGLQGIARMDIHGVPLWFGGADPRREGVAKGD